VKIRVGIGGWTYEPWRGTFYPRGLPKTRELEYASRRLSAIEVNTTFFHYQKRATFQRWHDEVPDDFVFSLKASRFCTIRKDLSATKDAIAKFYAQGFDALGTKLGPILWQLHEAKKFVPDEIDAFLSLLPRDSQHVLEPRHESFATPAMLRLAKKHGVALIRTDSTVFPTFEPTAKLTYARLVCSEPKRKTGYAPAKIAEIAAAARAQKIPSYIFFINGAKERAPAAAEALIAAL
jgi:uncharacterized protein YecE (DUF72 family)